VVVVVVVSVVDPDAGLVDSAGVMLAMGDSAGLAAVVVVLFVVVSVAVAGDSAGEAAGAAVSVFCSQAARRAALARMQIYFFIICGCRPMLG
jgi:hypothetical protein